MMKAKLIMMMKAKKGKEKYLKFVTNCYYLYCIRVNFKHKFIKLYIYRHLSITFIYILYKIYLKHNIQIYKFVYKYICIYKIHKYILYINIQKYMCCVLSCSIMSDSLQTHGLQPARFLCPWGFSWQEYWSQLACPPPGDLSNPEIKPGSPALQVILY